MCGKPEDLPAGQSRNPIFLLRVLVLAIAGGLTEDNDENEDEESSPDAMKRRDSTTPAKLWAALQPAVDILPPAASLGMNGRAARSSIG